MIVPVLLQRYENVPSSPACIACLRTEKLLAEESFFSSEQHAKLVRKFPVFYET